MESSVAYSISVKTDSLFHFERHVVVEKLCGVYLPTLSAKDLAGIAILPSKKLSINCLTDQGAVSPDFHRELEDRTDERAL